MLSPRKILILRALRRYFYLRTSQLSNLIMPRTKDRSGMRELLRALEVAKLIRRHDPSKIDPLDPTTVAPIWALTLKGSNVLAAETGECSLLLTTQPSFNDYLSMNHYCALSSVHIQIDAAFAAQDRVKMTNLYFEHEQVNPDADDPSKKFRLHTTAQQSPKIVCCPDSAFETVYCGIHRAWYVEREMGSDSPSRVCAVKHKGYYHLSRTQLFKNHFPLVKDFRVLAICPNAGWRDSLRKQFKEQKGDKVELKPGAELWLFAAVQDVTAEKFLTEPFLYTVDRGPLPFVPRTEAPTGVSTRGGEKGGAGGGGELRA